MSFDINLPGKALRTLVELRGLPSGSTCVLKPSLVKLISKDANLVLYLSDYKLDYYSN